MTEKRFTVSKIMPMWVNDKQTNYCYSLTTRKDANHLSDLLNELHEENKELKGKLEVYRELYPTGKWITELTSEELKKEARKI